VINIEKNLLFGNFLLFQRRHGTDIKFTANFMEVKTALSFDYHQGILWIENYQLVFLIYRSLYDWYLPTLSFLGFFFYLSTDSLS
jgi:hypothetical protein